MSFHVAEQFSLFDPPRRASEPFRVGKELASPYDRRFSGPPPEMRFALYTDGSCARNPGGPGGWCAILLRSGQRLKTVSGHSVKTTNNREELRAILEGLKLLNAGDGVDIVTDSQYAQKGASLWIKQWIRNGWRTGNKGRGGPVKNYDLWREIYELKRPLFCRFVWVRGHNGDKWNEECDRIAALRAADKIPFEYKDELDG